MAIKVGDGSSVATPEQIVVKATNGTLRFVNYVVQKVTDGSLSTVYNAISQTSRATDTSLATFTSRTTDTTVSTDTTASTNTTFSTTYETSVSTGFGTVTTFETT